MSVLHLFARRCCCAALAVSLGSGHGFKLGRITGAAGPDYEPVAPSGWSAAIVGVRCHAADAF